MAHSEPASERLDAVSIAKVEDPDLVLQSGGGGDDDEEPGRDFDVEAVITRAVKMGDEDTLRAFTTNPERFWGAITDVDTKYLQWVGTAARRGHVYVIRELWGLQFTRSDGSPPLKSNLLKTIIYGAARRGNLNVLNWMWGKCPTTADVHGRAKEFTVGPCGAAKGGFVEILKWFSFRGYHLKLEEINYAIERGHPDVVEWFFQRNLKLRQQWKEDYGMWYHKKRMAKKIDRGIHKAMLRNRVYMPPMAQGVSRMKLRYWPEPHSGAAWARYSEANTQHQYQHGKNG